MTRAVPEQTWQAVRGALARTTERFATMVAGADRRAMATADWSVPDTAAHVLIIATMYTWVVDRDRNPLPIPELAEPFDNATVEQVHSWNAMGLRLFTERDPQVLAERLRSCVGQLLRDTEQHDPATPLPWLGGSLVPVAGVLAHLLNELQIHGRDIARGLGGPWSVPAAEAAFYLDQFYVGMLGHTYGRLLDDCTAPPLERRIAVEFRSRYTNPAIVVLHRGKVSLGEPRDGVDVRIRYDPVTLNLMLFGRVSQVRAALTGKILVSGRHPWLLPVFQRTVYMPH
jgi:uncharacterized protein (TIGR03083 family)